MSTAQTGYSPNPTPGSKGYEPVKMHQDGGELDGREYQHPVELDQRGATYQQPVELDQRAEYHEMQG